MTYDETAVVAEIRRITLTDLRLCVREGWVRPAEGPAGPVFDELDISLSLIEEMLQRGRDENGKLYIGWGGQKIAA